MHPAVRTVRIVTFLQSKGKEFMFLLEGLMVDRIIYAILMIIGVGAAWEIADRLGLFDDEEPVSQSEEEEGDTKPSENTLSVPQMRGGGKE
jgi:hypothetical protein